MSKLSNGVVEDYDLAINLYDIQRIDEFTRIMIKLAEKLNKDPSAIVKADKSKPDEVGVIFTCDLLTAATVCDIIREHDRKAGIFYPTRVYLKKPNGGVWTKLPNNAILTIIENSRNNTECEEEAGNVVILNPKIFLSPNSKKETITPRLSPPESAKIVVDESGGFL